MSDAEQKPDVDTALRQSLASASRHPDRLVGGEAVITLDRPRMPRAHGPQLRRAMEELFAEPLEARYLQLQQVVAKGWRTCSSECRGGCRT